MLFILWLIKLSQLLIFFKSYFLLFPNLSVLKMILKYEIDKIFLSTLPSGICGFCLFLNFLKFIWDRKRLIFYVLILLTKCPQQPRLSLADIKSQKLRLGLPVELQEPIISYLPKRIIRKLDQKQCRSNWNFDMGHVCPKQQLNPQHNNAYLLQFWLYF